MLRQGLSNNRAGLHKGLGFLALLCIAGCTYVEQAGFTEWDYKALEKGYNLECRCCGDTPSCRWTNAVNAIND